MTPGFQTASPLPSETSIAPHHIEMLAKSGIDSSTAVQFLTEALPTPAPPTRKNQRTTSCPAPISANVPYQRGSRFILSALL